MRPSILTCHFFSLPRRGNHRGGEWWRGNSHWFCSVHLQHQWLEWCHTAWLAAHCAKTVLLAECHMIQLTEKNWVELLRQKKNMLMKKILCSLKLLDEGTYRNEGVKLLNTEVTKVLSATHLETLFCLQSSAQSHLCWAAHFTPGFDPQSPLLPRKDHNSAGQPGSFPDVRLRWNHLGSWCS